METKRFIDADGDSLVCLGQTVNLVRVIFLLMSKRSSGREIYMIFCK